MEVRYIHESDHGTWKACGNIRWKGKWPMRRGNFPADHPCVQNAEGLQRLRDKGYFARPFPEGDGITLDVAGRAAEQVIADIEECFGWQVERPNPNRPNPWAVFSQI